ncbi:MAG: DUF1801 domain-containing protein [Bacteroidota bacterium]
MREFDNFFLQNDEETNECFLALKNIILNYDPLITSAWKYGMPFFCYKGKMFCYLRRSKKYKKPYIGFVEGKLIEDSNLLQEDRSRMKILLIDSNQDIPFDTIQQILGKAISIYTQGIVKIRI